MPGKHQRILAKKSTVAESIQGHAKSRKVHDLVEVQISVKAKLPDGRRPSKKLLDEFVRRTADGEQIPGVEVRLIRWRNPGTGVGKTKEWQEWIGKENICPYIRRVLQRAKREISFKMGGH